MPHLPTITFPRITHRRFNDILTLLVIALSAYILATPFIPNVTLLLKQQTGQAKPLSITDPPPGNVEGPNKLVIPDININDQIYEGEGISTLSKGIWRRPLTSTPDKGGNTVLVAHRFDYNAPAVFYHLDKLKVGTIIAVNWNNKSYRYKIRETKIVEPDAVQIENNTREPILTLYTCTPMWTAKQRIVIIAEPVEGNPS